MKTQGDRTSTHHYLVLDSLRGVCACIVALYHFHTNGMIFASPLVAHGFEFVDFFFVLSGFVITKSYRDKIAAGFPFLKFMGLRFGRIYPLHFAILMIFVAFEIFFALFMPNGADRKPFSGNNSPEGIAYESLLIQVFFGSSAQWNLPAWSIAVEFWTYAIFAVIYRNAGRFLIPVCVSLTFGGLAILSIATDRYLNVFHEWSIVRCIVGFSLGVAANHVFGMMPRLGHVAATLLEFVVSIAVTWYISTADGILTLAAPLLFFVVVVVFAGQAGFLSAVLMTKPLLYLGTLSYSIYMVHYFIQLRMVNILTLISRMTHGKWSVTEYAGGANQVGGDALFGDLMSLTMLILVVCAAMLTHRFIELPGQRYSRALLLGNDRRARRSQALMADR